MRQVKCLLVFFFIILPSLLLFAQKENLCSQDGNDWITKGTVLKVGYIQGFISGTALMNEKAIQQSLILNEKEKKGLNLIVKFKIDTAFSTADAISLYEITTGQLSEGVEAFYSDFSTRKIKILDAIYIVKMQIKGTDPDVISAQTRYLKQQPISVEEWTAVWDKTDGYTDLVKALGEGKITAEDLLKIGFYVNKDKKLFSLFCYGNY
jgi:hypothetical protein